MNGYATLSIAELVLGGTSISLLVGLTTYLLMRMREAERLRVEAIEQRRHFESTKTETPLDQPNLDLKKRSLLSVHQLFRSQRWMVMGAFMMVGFFVIVPLAVQSVPAAYTPLLLGAFSVVLGIAARPFIENVIAGLIISLGRAVRLGDTVLVDGHYGTVENLNLTNTVVRIWDWRRYVVPNSRMMSKEFVNYSLVDGFIWAHAELFISPDADLERAEAIAIEEMAMSPYFKPYEEPRFWVMEITKESVRCWVAGWADTPSDAWMLGHDTRRRLALRYREENINFNLIHVNTGLTQAPSAPQPTN